MHRFNRGIIAKLTLAGLCVAGSVAAGSVSNQTVNVWTSGSVTYGNGVLRAARYSSDSVQYIGCSRYAYESGSNSITCYAKAANGDYVSCWTGDDNMLRSAETLNSAGYLYIGANADGECNRVITVTASYDI